MRFLLTITFEGGEVVKAWTKTEAAGRSIAEALGCGSMVDRVVLYRMRALGVLQVIVEWECAE